MNDSRQSKSRQVFVFYVMRYSGSVFSALTSHQIARFPFKFYIFVVTFSQNSVWGEWSVEGFE